MTDVRFVAIGDSFTEGVGDERGDGSVRGWADLVAQGWAADTETPISYANLAIRGRLAWPIVEEQLEPALALRPTHLSFNGGGNDMLRPNADIEHLADAFTRVLRRCDEEGVRLIVLSGANPSRQLPFGNVISRRGDQLSDAVLSRVHGRDDVVRALNWPDTTLSEPRFWGPDRLHMNTRGHYRVAARVLRSLGLAVPASWWDRPDLRTAEPGRPAAYYVQHVGPWVRRRLTRTSSGDGRAPKIPTWELVRPRTLV